MRDLNIEEPLKMQILKVRVIGESLSLLPFSVYDYSGGFVAESLSGKADF